MRAWLIALAVLLVPRGAPCCLNSVRSMDPAGAEKIALQAERALERGRYEEALRLVRGLDPGPRGNFDIVSPDAVAPVWGRRLRLEGVAYLRTGSTLLGLSILETLLEAKPGDPYLRARVAEGLVGRDPARALQVLEGLERADLMPDGEAYLALARLRAEAGDDPGRDQAMKRCRQRSVRPAACRLPPAEEPTGVAVAMDLLRRDPRGQGARARQLLEALDREGRLFDRDGILALIRLRAEAGDGPARAWLLSRCGDRTPADPPCKTPGEWLAEAEALAARGEALAADALLSTHLRFKDVDAAVRWRWGRLGIERYKGLYRMAVLSRLLLEAPDEPSLLASFAAAMDTAPIDGERYRAIARRLRAALPAQTAELHKAAVGEDE